MSDPADPNKPTSLALAPLSLPTPLGETLLLAPPVTLPCVICGVDLVFMKLDPASGQNAESMNITNIQSPFVCVECDKAVTKTAASSYAPQALMLDPAEDDDTIMYRAQAQLDFAEMKCRALIAMARAGFLGNSRRVLAK